MNARYFNSPIKRSSTDRNIAKGIDREHRSNSSLGGGPSISLPRNHEYMVPLKVFYRPAESNARASERKSLLTKNRFHEGASGTVGGALLDWRYPLGSESYVRVRYTSGLKTGIHITSR